MQTNGVGILPFIVSVSAALVSYMHIKVSRPYKELMRKRSNEPRAKRLEVYLKVISLGTIAACLLLQYSLGSYFKSFLNITTILSLLYYWGLCAWS